MTPSSLLASQLSRQAHLQMAQPPPPPCHDDGAMYAAARMQHSTESALQGWSVFGPPARAGDAVAPEGAAVPAPGGYRTLPSKRSWDASFRDAGGGGGVGGEPGRQ